MKRWPQKLIAQLDNAVQEMSDLKGKEKIDSLVKGEIVEYETAFSGRVRCRIVDTNSTKRNGGGFLHTVMLEILSYLETASEFDKKRSPVGKVFETPAGNCIKIQ